jgi:Ca2+-binding RTX toxin-like protein
MVGGNGNDVLAVGSAGGNGEMRGDAGNDTLYGGSGSAGNDTMLGGSGSDLMYGADGNDIYRFLTADLVSGDFDTILGFNAGDALSFSAGLNGSISGSQQTFNGVSGSYVASTSGWSVWLPYTTWASVQTQIVYA